MLRTEVQETFLLMLNFLKERIKAVQDVTLM